jgi:hypothetical protein
MGKIYTHRVERVWVWDPKTHTHKPKYPSNSLTCGPLEYEQINMVLLCASVVIYENMLLFTSMCCRL